MSNRNEDRTLSGSTQIYADILDLPSTINAIRIKNNAGSVGQVLSKNPTTNKLEFAVVPIADGTITTAMLKDLAVTNAKIANTTITGGKLATNINIDTSGGIEANNLQADNDLVVNGNTNLNGIVSLGDATSDVVYIKGTALIMNGASAVGTIAGSTSTLTIPNGAFNNGITVGQGGQLIVSNSANTAVFGSSAIFGGEMSMASGGGEVFDMNDHNITDCGGIAFTTGSDITNCDSITANTLVLNTALDMDGIDLDLGSGDLDCADITATNLTVASGTITGSIGGASKYVLNHTNGVLSCKGIGTDNGAIDAGSGQIDCGVIDCGRIESSSIDAGSSNISTTGTVAGSFGDFNTLSGNTSFTGILSFNYGSLANTNSGEIYGYAGRLNINMYTGIISCKALDTQNSTINTGTGTTTTAGVIIGDSGIVATSISGAESQTINGFNIYETLNDIPRILAHKSLNADYLITRTLGTSYVALDSTHLLISFKVPPSLKIAVSYGFMCYAPSKVISVKLVSSDGTEFFTKYINDTSLSKTTNNTILLSTTGNDYNYIEGTFFFTFDASDRGSTVNLTPMARSSKASSYAYTGTTSSSNYPAFYIKAESMGSTSAFGNTILYG